jgi:alpha-ribazole phosphatase
MGEYTIGSQRYLYLLRHGEIKAKSVLAGHTDFKLSDFGLQQLIAASDDLIDIEHCISSPLNRCLEFSQQFAEQQKIELTVDPRLKEMDFGDFDGKLFEELWDKQKLTKFTKADFTIGDFWQDPWNHHIPSGETMTLFTQRVDNWWQQFLVDKQLGNVLVVTHAGVIKHLLARILGIPILSEKYLSTINVGYGCLIKIAIFDDENGRSWPQVYL